MPATWIDTVSKANWPAARVRNVAEALSDEMYLEKPPRMSRDKALEWMAHECRLPLTGLLLMSPVVFAMKYVYGGYDNDYKARRQACELVHGTGSAGSAAYYGNDNYDAAPAWQVDLAREELAAAAAPPPVAVPPVAVPPVAVPSLAVPAGAGVYRMPTNALGRASEESETCFPVVERTGPGYDDDDDDEVAPTANEAAETLASMLQTIKAREAAEAEEADWDAIKAKQKQEFEMRLFLSDRLVAAEIKMGLLTDEAAASASLGVPNSTQLMARMIAIMGKLCDME